MRPLLFDLEDEFCNHAGDDQQLDAHELTKLWKSRARARAGTLSDEDADLIENSSKEMFHKLDVDGSGTVSYHEFVAHSMGGLDERGQWRQMRRRLGDVLKKDPTKLESLIERFKLWDANADGVVTRAELEEHIEQLCETVSEKGGETNGLDIDRLKKELFEHADVDCDGGIDLWEFIGWALGRRRTPVELLLYDVSKGVAKWAGPLLLGRTDIEVYHSSVLAFGSEYWYGGKVFRSEPPCSAQFGMPVTESAVLKLQASETRPELHVLRLGYTFATHAEFVEFLQAKVVQRYTGIEGYDLLTHSCNHFSDECVHFLLGRGVPAKVLELQKMALTPAVQSIRPFLNRYLGGFSENTGGGDQLLEDSKVTGGPDRLDPEGLLGAGDVVVLDAGAAGIGAEGAHVVATLVGESGGSVDVRYFDDAEGRVVALSGLPSRSIVKRLAQGGNN